MAKVHTTLTLEGSILQRAKALNINLSGTFEQYLDSLVNQKNADVDGINLDVLNIQIVRLQTQFNKMQVELQAKLKRKEEVMEKMRENEQRKLEEEKERAEKTRRCANCGKVLEESKKKHDFKKGCICNTCFLNAHKDDIERWDR